MGGRGLPPTAVCGLGKQALKVFRAKFATIDKATNRVHGLVAGFRRNQTGDGLAHMTECYNVLIHFSFLVVFVLGMSPMRGTAHSLSKSRPPCKWVMIKNQLFFRGWGRASKSDRGHTKSAMAVEAVDWAASGVVDGMR